MSESNSCETFNSHTLMPAVLLRKTSAVTVKFSTADLSFTRSDETLGEQKAFLIEVCLLTFKIRAPNKDDTITIERAPNVNTQHTWTSIREIAPLFQIQTQCFCPQECCFIHYLVSWESQPPRPRHTHTV